MRVLSITDTESLAGAGIAALRIHRALTAAGARAEMAVARRGSSAEDVVPLTGRAGQRMHAVRRAAMKLALRACGARSGEVLSANLLPTGLQRRINARNADIVHLHWVGVEMLRIEEFARIRAPIVWTMHDEWFVLGLEHYAEVGGSVRQGIDTRSAGRNARFELLDQSVRRRKAAAWRACELEIVCPSRWLADRILASGLIPAERVHVIRNAVPLDVFRPDNRAAARARLGVPLDRPVIGMGALKALDDPRKGYVHLREALAHVAALGGDRVPTVLVFGGDGGADLPLPSRFAGVVTSDSELAQLYAAMDVFVCPSRQENLPNTVAEALSCGVPSVAFDVGGIPDLIEHGVTGYLARPYDAADLARGVLECIQPSRQQQMAKSARNYAVLRLDGASVALQYLDLFRGVLDRARSRRM